MLDATAADRLVATVNEDLFCIGCEYNLRTQPLDAACPECGRSVRETLDFRAWRAAPHAG